MKGLDGRKDTIKLCFFVFFFEEYRGKCSWITWTVKKWIGDWKKGFGGELQGWEVRDRAEEAVSRLTHRRAPCQRDYPHWVSNLTFERFSSALLTTAGPESQQTGRRAELTALYIKASGHQRRGRCWPVVTRGRGDAGGGTPRFRPSHQQNWFPCGAAVIAVCAPWVFSLLHHRKGFWGGKKKLKIHQPQRFDSQKRKCDK